MSNQKNYWPDEWEQGLIKTQNAMGVMFKELSPAAETFVQYAKIAKLPLLDIGAAYGATAIPALENGAKVIACDLCEEHLSKLRQSTDPKWINKLKTLAKKFPELVESTSRLVNPPFRTTSCPIKAMGSG